jgi:exopolysaccharide production protein ExoZ
MLRAIAATMVVFVHVDTELIRLHHRPLGTFWLAAGVDIFFVISGFIMWTSVERRHGMTAVQFLKNRIIRIVPLYWLMTAFVLVVVSLAPHAARTTKLQPFHAIASFLFLPARHPVTGAFWPVVVAGWSLNYEMLFYVVFAVALAFSNGRRVERFLLIFSMLSAVLLIGRILEPRIDVMHFYANPVTAEFVIGILLAILCGTNLLRPSYAYFAAVPMGFYFLWASSHLHIWSGTTFIGASLIVAGAALMPPIRKNFVSDVGDASYSLYLTHGVVLAGLAFAYERLFVTVPPLIFIASGLACAFTIAFVVYNHVELPITALLKRRLALRVHGTSAEHGLASKSVPLE